MSTYLVTGAAGFIGGHLCVHLGEQGHHVVGLDAMTDYYARDIKVKHLEWVKERCQLRFIEDDLATADLAPLLSDVAGVFHLAGQPGVRASWGAGFGAYLTRNLLATQRLFESAAAAGIRVVYASSSSVYGDAETFPTSEDVQPRPLSPYGITKLACEHLARALFLARGLDSVGLRYFTVYGPNQRPDMAFTRVVNRLLLAQPFTILGDGTQSRDFTYVLDAARATASVMEDGRVAEVYNVGGGSETTLTQAIGIMEELSGKRLEIIYEPVAAGDVRRTASDTTRIRRDVGWKPQVALRDGLASQLAWAQSSLRTST